MTRKLTRYLSWARLQLATKVYHLKRSKSTLDNQSTRLVPGQCQSTKPLPTSSMTRTKRLGASLWLTRGTSTPAWPTQLQLSLKAEFPPWKAGLAALPWQLARQRLRLRFWTLLALATRSWRLQPFTAGPMTCLRKACRHWALKPTSLTHPIRKTLKRKSTNTLRPCTRKPSATRTPTWSISMLWLKSPTNMGLFWLSTTPSLPHTSTGRLNTART